MKFLQTLKQKVIIIFSIFFIIFGGFLYLNIGRLIELTGDIDDIYNTGLKGSTTLIEADRDIYQSKLAMNTLIMEMFNGLTFSEAKELVDDITSNAQQVLDRYTIYSNLVLTDKTQLNQFTKVHNDFTDRTNLLINLLEQGDVEEAYNRFVDGEYAANFSDLRNRMDIGTEYSLSIADEKYIESQIEGKNTVIAYYVIIAILFIFVVIITIIMNVLVVNPMNHAVSLVRNLSDGDGDLTRRMDERRQDEIGNFSKLFNKFLVNLTGIVKNVMNSINNSQLVKNELVESSKTAENSVHELENVMGHILEEFTILEEDVSKTSELVYGVNDNINVLDASIESQSSMSEESTAAITQMIASINNVANISNIREKSTQELSTNASNSNKQLIETVNVIEGINNNIDSVKNLTTIISQLSSQTNLLAMNAAIEAAHAGDAGRGFAVVADEIRKLAEISTKNVTEIDKVLQEMIQGISKAAQMGKETREAYKVMSQEVVEVASGLSEISVSTDELKTGGDQILVAMNELNDITISVREQGSLIRETIDSTVSSMSKLQDVFNIVKNSTVNMQTDSKQIKGAIDHISEFSKSLEESTNNLDHEMRRFKI